MVYRAIGEAKVIPWEKVLLTSAGLVLSVVRNNVLPGTKVTMKLGAMGNVP